MSLIFSLTVCRYFFLLFLIPPLPHYLCFCLPLFISLFAIPFNLPPHGLPPPPPPSLSLSLSDSDFFINLSKYIFPFILRTISISNFLMSTCQCTRSVYSNDLQFLNHFFLLMLTFCISVLFHPLLKWVVFIFLVFELIHVFTSDISKVHNFIDVYRT